MEDLNAKLQTTEVHTGVYLNNQRRSCVIVKVKEGIVWYLTLTEGCAIDLQQSFKEKFVRDWPIELYHYPAVRALRNYARFVVKDGFKITPEARKVVNAVLAR